MLETWFIEPDRPVNSNLKHGEDILNTIIALACCNVVAVSDFFHVDRFENS